jgi:hypothetical protein
MNGNARIANLFLLHEWMLSCPSILLCNIWARLTHILSPKSCMEKRIHQVIFNMTNFNVKKEFHILRCCWFEYVLVLTQIQRDHWILGFNQVDSTIGIQVMEYRSNILIMMGMTLKKKTWDPCGDDLKGRIGNSIIYHKTHFFGKQICEINHTFDKEKRNKFFYFQIYCVP